MAALRWDIFCHVVDNFGDVGVCARLARQLAARGLAVRLIIDDASALAWMAPQGLPGVQVLAWPGPADAADVVVEAFGCDPPPAYVHAMLARAVAPVWINLEYLSAESYVERAHGLPSPQRNGLGKWFFYPGFTTGTGGLLREDGLTEARHSFNRQAWLAQQGLSLHPGERLVNLFCYDNPALPDLLADLAQQPTLLLLTPGHAQRLVTQPGGALRVAHLPWLSQDNFDRLLWSGDLNFVRGEDSLVRALWAGAAFVWQVYPQSDGAHWVKLDALLARGSLPPQVAALWRAWNRSPGVPWPGLPPAAEWADATLAWRRRLLAQRDLATQLHAFALAKAAQSS